MVCGASVVGAMVGRGVVVVPGNPDAIGSTCDGKGCMLESVSFSDGLHVGMRMGGPGGAAGAVGALRVGFSPSAMMRRAMPRAISSNTASSTVFCPGLPWGHGLVMML